ncbi:alpha/beta fold hydrolase [Paenibacillus thalictri]|uniref:Alpha/beta hydrolase n=1 Tax=Paenibacillus thalictri TaxID=2527873 RepID=A0A4Q9DWI6_9BACL|nr:alpha/beta hydrolase [Paenibacillus thalictri]TBL80369.1 alpha/beta hydrolase [Paenibacillus thalictri]
MNLFSIINTFNFVFKLLTLVIFRFIIELNFNQYKERISFMTNPKNSSFLAGTVISKDGTRIGYQSIGVGPGLLVIHGALSTSEHFTKLAEELADSIRVHVMDRRGRRNSGSQGKDYCMEKECEDVAAVQQETGAEYVFGHSYGGLVAMEVARTLGLFRKIAVYEPGVSIHSKPNTWDWLPFYEEALRKNDTRGAFACFVQGAGHSPLTKLPLWYAKFMLRLFIRGEHWREKEVLLKQNLLEHKEVRRLEGTYPLYETIRSKMLLAYGGKSPEAVAEMIRMLHQTIPHAQMLEIPRLHHLSPENQYEPLAIARQVKRFFLYDKNEE